MLLSKSFSLFRTDGKLIIKIIYEYMLDTGIDKQYKYNVLVNVQIQKKQPHGHR